MKAYRIYHINKQGEKIYSCETPGCWAHHCASPEYAVPFLEIEQAQKSADLEQKYVCPSGVERHIEEYEEERPLLRHKYDRNVRLAEFYPYYTDKGCYAECQG